MSFNINDFDIFNNLDLFKKVEEKKDIKCCDDPNYNYDQGMQCCINCGRIDTQKIQFSINTYDDGLTYNIKYPYKRIVYFKQKLDLINSYSFYKRNPKLTYFIECNKDKEIKSIYKLKKALKKSGLNKQYKYIYSIYNAITHKKLIDIDKRDYPFYLNQFKRIEDIFVKHKVRHNLYSYNVIIYFLLRLNNNDGYKNLILPLNKVKLKKKIRSLMLLCGYKNQSNINPLESA